MELLDTNRRPLPAVNAYRAGKEADLSWAEHCLILEIDGPQFHRDKLEDARKTATWTTAGWTVRRIDSDDIFRRPERLLALAPPYTNSSSITRIARGESRTKSSPPISAIAS
jgi:hypothetical protein